MTHPNDRRQDPNYAEDNYPEANGAPEHRGVQGGPDQQSFPTTHRAGAVPEQERLRREERRLAEAQRATVADKFIQTVYYLVGALELLLGLRFLLRLTAANQDNTFANFIYGLSEPFVSPFSTLFVSPTFNGSRNIFDINLLVAMVAYLVLMFLVVRLIRILAEQ